MKIIKPLALGSLIVLAAGLFGTPSAQAGTRVSINIGGGGYCAPVYYPQPVAYCPPPPVYVQPVYRPVYYQPAYCPPPRVYYPQTRGYYPQNRGYYQPQRANYPSAGYQGGYAPRQVYYSPGYR